MKTEKKMNLEKIKWNLGKIKTDFIGPYIYIYIYIYILQNEILALRLTELNDNSDVMCSLCGVKVLTHRVRHVCMRFCVWNFGLQGPSHLAQFKLVLKQKSKQ